MIETRQLPAAKIFMLLQSHAPKISNSFILSPFYFVATAV